MDATLPEVKFLVAYNPGPETRHYRSPRPGEVPDLALLPWKYIPVDRSYLEQNPYFRRDVQAGAFKVEERDLLPPNPSQPIADRWYTQLDDNQRQMVISVCTEDFTEQIQKIVSISDLLDSNGLPRKDSRITPKYLKEKHLPFLQGSLDLEMRWRNRKDVKAALKKAIQRIEKL